MSSNYFLDIIDIDLNTKGHKNRKQSRLNDSVLEKENLDIKLHSSKHGPSSNAQARLSSSTSDSQILDARQKPTAWPTASRVLSHAVTSGNPNHSFQVNKKGNSRYIDILLPRYKVNLVTQYP